MTSLLLLLACNTPVTDGAPTPAATNTANAAAPAAATSNNNDLAEGHVVAKWEGGQLTYSDLRADIDTQLSQLEMEYLQNRYRTQLQAAEGSGIRAIVEAEAAAQGKTDEELITAEIDGKIAKPTEAEIEEFYPVVKRQLRGAPFDQAKGQVEAMLMERRRGEALQAYIATLREKYKLEIDVPYPDLPRIDMSADDDPSIGPADAKITIIEFGDYECGYCARAFSTVQQLREKYPDDVRIVYRDFPLSFHPRAVPAAVAANCAGEVGGETKYWEVHNSLMQNQSALQDDDLKAAVQKAGVDMSKWSTCITDDKQLAEIQKDFEDGSNAGVSGTPAFFINGIFLNGAQPLDQFEVIIKRELGG